MRRSDSALDVPPGGAYPGRPGCDTSVPGPSEARRAASTERKRAYRARHYVEPEPRFCRECAGAVPVLVPPHRGRRAIFCGQICRDRHFHRLAHDRRLPLSLASTRQRLAELDAEATESTAISDLVELALRSANVASGRSQIYLGLLARLAPAATRYPRGGRPRIGGLHDS